MLEIIKAQPHDISILREIAIESKGSWGYADHFMDQYAQAPILTAESIRADIVYKARRENSTVGWYRLILHHPIAEWEDLWVLPAEMGKGIGRALFQHMLGQARTAGCTAVEFDADPNAVPFHEHMGSVVIGQSWSEWQRYIPRMRCTVPFD
jgi:GNAT superfamily N-acetyltransferase